LKHRTNNIGCAILAGGNNSRFKGKNKAYFRVNNNSIIERTLEISSELFDEIFIITNDPDNYKMPGNYLLYPDILKNAGPLGGIYSALYHTSKEAVFVLPCDMPFLNPDIIKTIITTYNEADSEAVIPRFKNLAEPCHAIYKKSVLNNIYHNIYEKKDYSILNLFDIISVYYKEFKNNPKNKKAFININSPEDLKYIN